MNQLSSFLNKYRQIARDSKKLKETIIEIFNKHSVPGITIDSIKLQNNKLYLKINPVLRNEVFLKKKEILSSLNSQQDQYHFADIRF